MSLRINDIAPDFTADTTQGTISFHEWIGDGWAILFSHPKDFTPVCTTELGTMAGLVDEFAKRNCKVLGISVDGVNDHAKWSSDIESLSGNAINYPLVGDPTLAVVKQYDMLPGDAGETSAGRTPADNATARSVFVIGPDKRIKATLTYPMSTGRELRRDPPTARFVPAHGAEEGGDPRQLEAGERRHHPAGGERRRRQAGLPGRLAAAPALHPGGAATEVGGPWQPGRRSRSVDDRIVAHVLE